MEIEKKQPRKCGIYCFEAISGSRIGWKYIGKTKNLFSKRVNEHYRTLRWGIHYNHKLQRYYNKYGKKSLKLYIIDEYPEDKLNFYEKFWVECFDSYRNGFNKTKGGEDCSHSVKLFTFKNAKTGELIENITLKDFANKFNLNKNCVNAVASGSVKHIRYWFCPKYGELKIKKKKIYEVISPNGTNYQIETGHVKRFCEENNLNCANFFALLRKKSNISSGWTRPDSRIWTPQTDPCAGEYQLISPNGKLVFGKNITQFAKENNLNRLCLLYVINGKQKHHKGWRLYKGEMELKPFNKNDYPRNLPECKTKYKFKSPNGEVFEFPTNKIVEFCKKHGLNNSSLFYVWKGKYKQHKGWVRYNEDVI